MGADRKLIGTLGERFAAAILFSEGWRIRERNFRCAAGEIDIIAEDGAGCLCFVEVKTRMSRYTGRPAEAVDRNKQRRIRLAAQWYLAQKSLVERQVQFMVFEIRAETTFASFL